MPIAVDLPPRLAVWDLTGDLATFATGLGQMFSQVELFAEDTDTTVGWQALWDVNTAPTYALPWLAQVVGERVPAGSTDAQARALIQANPNAYRGTPLSIVNAVKQTLTGSQIVGFAEQTKQDGTHDVNWISIFTYLSQTPSQNAVLAALRRTVPADINYAYQCLAGPTWAGLQTGAGSGSWTNLYSHYSAGAWTTIENANPGYVLYT